MGSGDPCENLIVSNSSTDGKGTYRGIHVILSTTELIRVPRVFVSLEEGGKVRLDQVFLSAKLLVRGVLDA